MERPSEYTNFRERLLHLVRRPGGSGIIRISTPKTYTARLKSVGIDFVEFEELNPQGDPVATHMFFIRQITGLQYDTLDGTRTLLERIFRAPPAEQDS